MTCKCGIPPLFLRIRYTGLCGIWSINSGVAVYKNGCGLFRALLGIPFQFWGGGGVGETASCCWYESECINKRVFGDPNAKYPCTIMMALGS